MTHTLARTKLARAARILNARGGFAGLLPSLILMTDDLRLADPMAAASALPRGSLVIVRSKDAARRAKLAHDAMAIARARDLLVSIASDPALAIACGADGLHLPEARAPEAAHWRACAPRLFITVSAHSGRSVARAAGARANAAILAQAFASGSHPERSALGPVRLRLIARMVPLPVYALGGIDEKTVMRLSGARLAGVAAIAALDPG